MNKIIAGVAMAAMTIAGTATAATYTVKVVNVTDLNANQSQATMSNFDTYYGDGSGTNSDQFTYDGILNFGTSNTSDDSTTIAQWLGTGGGTVSGLSAVGDLQQSAPNVFANPATDSITTFYLFKDQGNSAATSFEVTHDDGVWLFDDGSSLGGSLGPNSVKVTTVNGFDGGELSVLYVATNGDPSILEVKAVPLPAGVWLFGSALVGLAGVARRRTRNLGSKI